LTVRWVRTRIREAPAVTDPRRPLGRTLLRLGRRCLPVLVSAGLVSWLVWRVSPERLAATAAVLDWPVLAGLTAALFLALLFWDTVCLKWLFAQPDHPLPFLTVLHARSASYAWTVINYEVGQGVLAWRLGRARAMPLGAAIGRTILLALHDVAVLLSLALLGSLAGAGPRPRAIAIGTGAGLAGLAVVAVVLKRLPPRWRGWLPQRGSFLDWWGLRHSLTLLGLRLLFFAIIWAYVALALRVCGFPEDARLVGGVIPLALTAEALPSVSGLGTRDSVLKACLQPSPEQEAVLLGFTLVWSTGLLILRLTVGLVSWWLPWRKRTAERLPEWKVEEPVSPAG
jgi:hypothetical protein